MEARKQKPMRSALGRGLSSLISMPPVALAHTAESAEAEETIEPEAHPAISPVETAPPRPVHPAATTDPSASLREVTYVPMDLITNNPSQPRQDFSDSELKELSDSIRTLGVIQPVVVRPVVRVDGSGARYEIVAGERRWRAAKLTGLAELPAIIRELSDRDTLEIALVENIQRADLNPIEEALAYQKLMTEFGLSQSDVADRVGKDRASVANYLRILKLPQDVVDLLRRGEISMGHAKAICTIREPSAQIRLAQKTVKESLSVRALESIVSRVVVLDAGKRLPKRGQPPGAAQVAAGLTAFQALTDRMRNALGTKVTIKHHRSGRGRIEIEYFSEQELERIIEQISK